MSSRLPLFALALGLAPVTLSVACARQLNGPAEGTTTITSGTPGGVRVTGAQIERDDLSNRIADEMCNRESACSMIGDRDDARYRTVEACMSDQGTKSPGVIARWGCTPLGTSATFEACLATIRSARCDMKIDRADMIAECRRAAVCTTRTPD